MEPGSNGLAYNKLTDELLICQHGNRRLVAMNRKGEIRVIADHGPDGKSLNSPNDVAVCSLLKL